MELAADRNRVVERSLIGVRWLILVLQAGVAFWLIWSNDHRHEPFALLGLCGGLAALEGARLSGIRPGLLGHVTIDIAFLGATALVWGPHHPLQLLSLVEVALAASVMGPLATVWVVAMALGLMVTDGMGQADSGDDWLHVGSHVFISGLAVVALGGFSHLVGRQIRSVDEARRQALLDRERGGRLALVGTLASGVAHELGTPLGSITLLAEEVALELPETSPGHDLLTVLAGQVTRCRSILDRLLLSGHSEFTSTGPLQPLLTTWVTEWNAANAVEAELTRVMLSPDVGVRGTSDDWRGALWTLLDNGLKAGAPVSVVVEQSADFVEVHVDDSGEGPDEEVSAHAGEPFFSGWSGRGLGLYAVRTQLEKVGGRFSLMRRAEGGGRATLVIPVAVEAG